MVTVIGGYSLGEVADDLITYFDEYADKTKERAKDKNTGVYDLYETAMRHDIIYHYVTVFLGYTLFSWITFASHAWAEHFMIFNDDIDCDFNMMDQTVLDDAGAIFRQVTSLEKCYELVPQFLKVLDVNQNGWLDRCEDANNLVHLMGNTEAYGRKYSHALPHAFAYHRCDQLFNPLF